MQVQVDQRKRIKAATTSLIGLPPLSCKDVHLKEYTSKESKTIEGQNNQRLEDHSSSCALSLAKNVNIYRLDPPPLPTDDFY